MAISFGYHSLPNVTNGRRKPTVPAEFKLISGGYIEIMCLVDSGADVIVLPKGVAELLGVRLSGESTSNGIGGEVSVKKGRVSFRIKKEHGYHNINAPVEVMDTDDIPVLLGRQGFFDKFLVTINERTKRVFLKEHKPRILKK